MVIDISSKNPKTTDKKSVEIVWTVRAKRTLDNLLVMAIFKDTHSTKSEFIRQAVREKLKAMGISFQINESDIIENPGTKQDGVETKIEDFTTSPQMKKKAV